MPIYEYKCLNCGSFFQRSLPMSESGKTVKCNQCRKDAQKVLSVPNINTCGTDKLNNRNSTRNEPYDTNSYVNISNVSFKDCGYAGISAGPGEWNVQNANFENIPVGINMKDSTKLNADSCTFEKVNKPFNVDKE